MHHQSTPRASGHVYRKQRAKGHVWYWKIRLPDGREERRAIGPEWTGNGRPPSGYFTEKTAKVALEARLTDLRRGLVVTRTGATFADAAEHWYRATGAQNNWKPSTRRDYRSALDRHLLPAFGGKPVEALTTRVIEQWRAQRMADADNPLPRRTAVKLTAILHGIYERARRAYQLPTNPVADVERLRLSYDPASYDFYSPEEVRALVRVAASEQDGALFLTAAFQGLRLGEVLALRVRDVDFGSDALRVMGSVDIREGVGTPKSGHGRTVPMIRDVAKALARLLQREHFTGPDDFVFVGETGNHLDGSALRRRYKTAQAQAGLRKIRFHDLRHSFGSIAINAGSTVEVQAWMGHADGRTTARYLHYKRRSDEAQRLATAFDREATAAVEKAERP